MNDYICVTQAKKDYSLNENDLRNLECIYKRNPYYRSAPNMRLYLIKDIDRVYEDKKKHEQYLIDNYDKIQEQKFQEQKEFKENAKKKIENFVKTTQEFKQVGNMLPSDIWDIIINKIAKDEGTEDILSSPIQITRTLANIERTCKELRGITRYAWFALKPKNINVPDNLNNVLMNPTSFKITDLKEILKILDEPVSGTKAVLIMRILDFCNLKNPICASLSTVLAVLEEKRSKLELNILYRNTYLAHMYCRLRNSKNIFEYKQNFIEIFGTYNKYCIFQDNYLKEEKIRRQAQLEKQILNMKQSLVFPTEQLESSCIKCISNLRSPVCTNKCCAKCCGDYDNHIQCLRHNFLIKI